MLPGKRFGLYLENFHLGSTYHLDPVDADFLVLSSSCEKLHTGQLAFFFFPPERTTSLKYCPVPQEGFLAGCRFLSYWCPGLAGVLLNLKILSILTLLALSRVKVYKWRGKSNLNQILN